MKWKALYWLTLSVLALIGVVEWAIFDTLNYSLISYIVALTVVGIVSFRKSRPAN